MEDIISNVMLFLMPVMMVMPIFMIFGGILWHFFGTAQRRRVFKNTSLNADEKDEFTASPQYESAAAFIKPVLDKAEASRKKIVLVARAFKIVYGGAFLFALYFFDSFEITAFIFLYIFLSFIPQIIYGNILAKTVVPQIGRMYGFEYVPKGTGLIDELRNYETRAMKAPGNMSGPKKSLLFGEYEIAVPLFGFKSNTTAFDNVKYIRIRKNKDGGEDTETAFSGILLRIKMEQPYPCPILIREDKGTLGNKFLNDTCGMQRIGFEDSEFEKFFEVYAPDQIAARKALPPRFLEKIRNILTIYNEATVSALFFEDRLFLAINTGIFECIGVTPDMKSESYEVLGRLIKSFDMQKQIAESLE